MAYLKKTPLELHTLSIDMKQIYHELIAHFLIKFSIM